MCDKTQCFTGFKGNTVLNIGGHSEVKKGQIEGTIVEVLD